MPTWCRDPAARAQLDGIFAAGPAAFEREARAVMPSLHAHARELFEHGQALLRRIIDEKLLQPRGVYGFWPASGEGDDIVLYADGNRTQERARFAMLRQRDRYWNHRREANACGDCQNIAELDGTIGKEADQRCE